VLGLGVVAALAVSTAPRETGLGLQLDQGTRKSHSVAENSAFVTGFFRGMAEEKSFRQLVASLYFVYEAMERAFDETADERVRALDFPELRRLPALEEDMAFFFGTDWRASVRPSAATQAYVASIERAAAEQPELLIAHQYSRYLGDLFGGQMMSNMASKSLGLKSDGLAFYTFDSIPSPSAFITEWYSRLNALELTDVQREEIVEEANVVFRHNIAVFGELEGNPVRAAATIAWKTVRARVAKAFSRKQAS
jgi:heme oxygenase